MYSVWVKRIPYGPWCFVGDFDHMGDAVATANRIITEQSPAAVNVENNYAPFYVGSTPYNADWLRTVLYWQNLPLYAQYDL